MTDSADIPFERRGAGDENFAPGVAFRSRAAAE